MKNDYNRILFFGDKTEPGGNDYEIFNHDLTESYHVDNPEMTIGYLNSKFFDDVWCGHDDMIWTWWHDVQINLIQNESKLKF